MPDSSSLPTGLTAGTAGHVAHSNELHAQHNAVDALVDGNIVARDTANRVRAAVIADMAAAMGTTVNLLNAALDPTLEDSGASGPAQSADGAVPTVSGSNWFWTVPDSTTAAEVGLAIDAKIDILADQNDNTAVAYPDDYVPMIQGSGWTWTRVGAKLPDILPGGTHSVPGALSPSPGNGWWRTWNVTAEITFLEIACDPLEQRRFVIELTNTTGAAISINLASSTANRVISMRPVPAELAAGETFTTEILARGA